MAIPFLNNITIDDAGHIQFKTAAGANAGKIDQDGNNLVLTNAVGDILLGDGSSDVYIGDGTNNVDIIFEQSGSIKGDGSAVTLTIGGANTTLNLENPNINGTFNIGATTINNKLTFTTTNGYILFDYEPSGDTGEYSTEVPLLKVDQNGTESTILARVSEYRAVALGIDDTVWLRAGDTSSVIRDNVNLAAEVVLMSAESGFHAYGFPGNDTTWSNRNEFKFYSADGTTASNNGLYIGDGGSTQFIDLSRNLKNIGTISSGAITSTGNIATTASNATISAAESGGATTKIMGASVGRVGTSSNHNLEIIQNNSAAITIDTSQNVGIGTAPAAGCELHVNGEIRVDSTNGVATRKIRSGYFSTTTDIVVASGSSASVKLQNGTTDGLVIDSSQNATFHGDIIIKNHNGSNPTDAGSLYFNEAGDTWASDMYGFRINQEGSSNLLQFQSVYGDTNVNTILTLNRDNKNAIFGAKIQTSGEIEGGSLDINGNADISGNLTISGTVDGVDIATRDALMVTTSGSQTITGQKTFQGNLILDDGSGDTPILKWINGNDNTWNQYVDSNGDMILTRVGSGGAEFQFHGHATDYTNAELYVGGGIVTATKIGQWNTAYGWGNHASAGYLTSVPSNASALNLNATDDRDMAPEDLSYSDDLRIFFSAKEGLEDGTSTGTDWHDVLVLNSYSDSSGGNANVLAFDKNSYKIRHYQAGLSASNWGTAKELAYTDNANMLNSNVTLSSLGAQASGNYITGTGSLSAQDLTDIGNLSGTNTGDQDLSSYATLASPALTGNPTAPTQAAGNNTTRIATTAFVSTAVANIVDNAPEALDTLNELAAALGDDENFSTTITTSIGTKLANVVEDTSPQLGADLDMNGFAIFETDQRNSIDLKDHSGYTWLRNSPGQWTFQSGTSGDDWTQSWQLYVPNVGSDGGNDTFVELGQRHTNDTTGEFKGIKIVKRTGDGVVDGDLHAGIATFTGNVSVSGTVDGRDIATDGTKLDTIDTNADVTPSWVPSTNPNYLTSSSTQSKYLRSDQNDTTSGVLTVGGLTGNGTSGTHGGNDIYTLNMPQNPEGRHVKAPWFFNDMAYARLRGAAVSATVDGTDASNANKDKMFDASTGFWSVSTSGVTSVVVTIGDGTNDLPKSFTHGTHIGVTFGNTTWRANTVKIETYRSGAWNTEQEFTSNGKEMLVKSINHGSDSISRIRYTFSNFNTTSMRIVSLFAYNYNATGMPSLYLTKDGGEMYGDIDMGTNTITDTKVGQWDTAYGWGNHASAGYGTSNFDGAYGSLSGTPTIPSGNQIIDWTSDQGNTNIHANNYNNTQLSNSEVVAAVVASTNISSEDKGTIRSNIGAGSSSFSGAYNDLTGKPTLLELGTTSTTALAGNTSLFSGAYADLTGKPTIPSGNSIIDWTADHASETIHSGNITGVGSVLSLPSPATGIEIDSGNTNASASCTPLRLFQNGTSNESIKFVIDSSGSSDAKNRIISDSNDDNAQFAISLTNAGGTEQEGLIVSRGVGVKLGVVNEIGSDTNKFLMVDDQNGNVIEFVTGPNLRSYIGAGTSSFSGAYADLTGKPTLLALGTTSTTALAGNTTTISSAQSTKLGHISVTQAVDLDTIETRSNNGHTAYGWGDHADGGYLTSFDITTQTDSKYIRSNTSDNVAGHTEWQDGYEVRLGNSADMSIYHSSGNNYIDSNAGNLYIRANVDGDIGSNVYIRPHDNEEGIVIEDDAGVKLYYNNSQKMNTTSAGISVTGTVTASSTIGNKGTNIGQQIEYGDANVATLRCDADRWRVYMGGTGNSQETLTVNESGNVGIKDSTPSYRLDVNGTIRATSDVIAFSDERVKENIKTIDNSLEKVNKLRGVEFNKIGEDTKSIGVIAQEIEKILPEVVRTDDEGMKSVAYGNVVGILIEAVKELTKEVEELKKCNKCKNCNCNG